MTMTVPRLDRAPGIADPGRVPDAGGQRPDPEVPERARGASSGVAVSSGATSFGVLRSKTSTT